MIHPIFEVIRDADGRLESAAPHEVDGNGVAGLRESWMHMQLHPSTSRELLTRLENEIPDVLTDVRAWVARTNNLPQ